MANTFLSNKIIIPAVIFFGGLLIASGVLILANFSVAELSATSQSSEWTQPAGEGISAPACGSSSVSTSCQGGQAVATVNWTYSGEGIHAELPYPYNVWPVISCENASITGSGLPTLSSMPCSGSYTFSGLNSNTNYTYNILWTGIVCLEWRGGVCESPSQPVRMSLDSKNGSFTTPNCVPAPTVSMTANPTTINLGQSSTLSWSSTNATSCSIDQGIGDVSVNGTRLVSPITNTTYTITCSGPTAPSAQSSAAIIVNQPPGDFNLSVGGGLACNSVPLSWTAASGADGYRILRGSPRVDISPYQPYTALNFTDTSVSQNTSYVYQIEAYNASGVNRSNALNVDTPFCSPTLNFSGNPTSIFEGQSTTLTWSSSYATSCTASGAWSGSKAVNGGEVVIPSPPPSATYTLTCTGPGGSTGPQSVTINITPLALPDWKEIIPR